METIVYPPILDDVVKYKFSKKNRIVIKDCLSGIIGYVNFLDKDTVIVNVESNNYTKKKGGDVIKLGTWLDINSVCITKLEDSKKCKMERVLKKNISRISHNMCIFREKDNKCLYGIGGRYDKCNDSKKPRHRHHKGLYLLTTPLTLKNPWTILENEKPIISTDTLSPYKKPASYDSQLSCIYSTILNKYVLAVRCNIRRGGRYFSILFSEDCKNWSSFNRPLLDPPYNHKLNDQYYSVLLHEYKPKNILLGICLFFNEVNVNPFYGIKLLVSTDAINWKDKGILFKLPSGKMPRNGFTRPKVQCGGINSDDKGNITFFFYKYKCRNKLFYFHKTYTFDTIIKL